MAKTRKNNRQLKSMEEFKCNGIALKLVFTTLIVIFISLLFFSRGNTSQEVAKAETISIDLTNQFDTNQQKDTESAETSIPEANNIVETESQVETEKSVETEESAQEEESIEISEIVEESIDYNYDFDTNGIPPEELIVYEDFIVPITEYEINLMVRAVQHETGIGPWFYPDADYDYIQQCMARVIVNKVGTTGCGNTIYSTLILSGHFMTKEALFKTKIEQGQEIELFDPYDETTRRNVLTVLRGEDSISHTITVEMSCPKNCTLDEYLEIIKPEIGSVILYFWTVTAEGRTLFFAEPDESAKSE